MSIAMTAMTCVVEAYLYLMLFDAYLVKKERFDKDFYHVIRCAVAVGIFISNTFFSYGVLNSLGIFAVLFAASFCYRCHLAVRPVIAAFGLLLSVLSEIITLFALSAFSGLSTEQFLASDTLKYLGMIISKIFSFAVFRIISSNRKNKSQRKAAYWALFFLVFASSVLATFLFFNLSYRNPEYELSTLTVICAMGMLLSNFFVIYLYEYMEKQAEIISRQNFVEQQLVSQAKHFDEILFMQGELRKFRHDINNHMTALEEYFTNNDTDGGRAYIASMRNAVEKTKKSISTGNIALDAILNSKQAVAESKGIEFNTNIQIFENLGIEPIDICVIFGNALDNAIEACEKLSDGKFIRLQIIYDEDCVICKISNSCKKSADGSFKTTKPDNKNHGYGIENIKVTLSKYKHVFSIEQKENEFILSFIIFDVQEGQ